MSFNIEMSTAAISSINAVSNTDPIYLGFIPAICKTCGCFVAQPEVEEGETPCLEEVICECDKSPPVNPDEIEQPKSSELSEQSDN
jgi:hypothetical protein